MKRYELIQTVNMENVFPDGTGPQSEEELFRYIGQLNGPFSFAFREDRSTGTRENL